MTIQEAIDLLQEMLKCKNGDCDPRLCGECDLCQKRRDEIDEVWEMTLRSLEAWEKVLEETSTFVIEVFDRTRDFSDYGAAKYVLNNIIIKHLKQVKEGGSDNG